MTAPSDLKELLARVEKCAAPDRKLDLDICIKLDTGRAIRNGVWLGPAHFTATAESRAEIASHLKALIAKENDRG